MTSITRIAATFYEECFHEKPQHIFLSPGRINIIGEHIDYNNGYVLPAAIDKYVCIAISKTDNTECVLIAKDLNERYVFDINTDIVPAEPSWANYFLGIVSLLKLTGYTLGGFRLAFTSAIPIGAGLSSSAAVECGFAFALNELFNLGITRKDIALLGQRSENSFVGVQCGIMDQFASVLGKEKNVIFLDCDSLNYTYHEMDLSNHAILLLNSKVKHTHLNSGYNNRRQEAAEGLAIIQEHFPEVSSFRDCQSTQVETLRDVLGTVLYKRCRFVEDEIARVKKAVTALSNGDIDTLGGLMFDTHTGLSQLYEVSCAETDFLVEAVRQFPQVTGARMMGGGFGGCTINLVEKNYADELTVRIETAYRQKFNIIPEAYIVTLSGGTHEYTVS